MAPGLSRRESLLCIPAFALTPALAARAAQPGTAEPHASFPVQDAATVSAMVGAAHANREKVAELLQQSPELAKAAVDWGFGDWESALGAASHTGQREIALLLMQHGARPDIFTLAMLGYTGAVRAMVEAQPGIQRTLGPHGISLLRHARAGGEQAKETLEYLASLGDADNSQPNQALTAEQRRAYVGEYLTTDLRNVSVREQRETLQIRIGESSNRALFAAGDHRFHPAGAPSVTITFALEGDKVRSLRIDSKDVSLRANRQ